MRSDHVISIVSGKLSLKKRLPFWRFGKEHSHQYATNIHVLFRSRPLGARKLDNKTNSHSRNEKERWIFRLHVRDAVDERLCFNHAGGISHSINWANLKTSLSLCTSTGKLLPYIHECCHNNEPHLCRFLDSCTHEVDKHRRIKGHLPLH